MHFECNRSVFENGKLGNAAALDSIKAIISEIGPENIGEVNVTAYASPEGALDRNMQLSRERAAEFATIVKEYFPELDGKFNATAGGESWDLLRARVAGDQKLSEASRSAILNIIDNGSISLETRKWRLKNRLDAGIYRYLLDEHYTWLRCFEVVITYSIPQPEPEPVPEPVQEPIEPEPEPEPQPEPEPEPEPLPEPEEAIRPIIAFSTNALYDLAITPNFAIEVPLGQKWSVLAEYTFPWWVNRSNNRAWECLKWDLGARRWLSRHDASDPMDVLTGHFVGIDLAGGYYDIEPLHTGWQGEFTAIGLEYGYAWRLGSKWRLDACLALGFMSTPYRYYEGNATDSKLLYKYDGHFSWWGPTKAAVSIKYIFTTKPGRREK